MTIDEEKRILARLCMGENVPNAPQHGQWSTPAHEQIWLAAMSVKASGREPDYLLVAEVLQARGELAAVGGPLYLMQLDSPPELH